MNIMLRSGFISIFMLIAVTLLSIIRRLFCCQLCFRLTCYSLCLRLVVINTLSSLSAQAKQMVLIGSASPVRSHICGSCRIILMKTGAEKMIVADQGNRPFVCEMFIVEEMARKSDSVWVYVRTGFSSGSCCGTASSPVCSVKSSG